MIVYPEGSFYSQVTAAEVPEIVAGHLIPAESLLKNIFIRKQFDEDGSTIPLFRNCILQKQMRITLRNCGVIDPENIKRGYRFPMLTLHSEKVLTTMKPQDVIDELLAAGLRGRGGAGFPTGRKWALQWLRK